MVDLDARKIRERDGLTVPASASAVDLTREPAGLTPRQVSLAKKASSPEYGRVMLARNPHRTRRLIENALALGCLDFGQGEPQETEHGPNARWRRIPKNKRERTSVYPVVVVAAPCSFPRDGSFAATGLD